MKDIPFPDVLSETQKEALERKKGKDVKEQTVNKDVAKVLREREVNRVWIDRLGNLARQSFKEMLDISVFFHIV